MQVASCACISSIHILLVKRTFYIASLESPQMGISTPVQDWSIHFYFKLEVGSDLSYLRCKFVNDPYKVGPAPKYLRSL